MIEPDRVFPDRRPDCHRRDQLICDIDQKIDQKECEYPIVICPRQETVHHRNRLKCNINFLIQNSSDTAAGHTANEGNRNTENQKPIFPSYQTLIKHSRCADGDQHVDNHEIDEHPAERHTEDTGKQSCGERSQHSALPGCQNRSDGVQI